MGGIHAHQVRGTWEHFAPCINANVSHQRKTKQRKGNSTVVFGKNLHFSKTEIKIQCI